MIDRLCVHTFYKTDFVGDLAGVRHKVAYPCATLPVLVKWLHGREQQLAVRFPRHGAEPLAVDIFLRDRRAMQFLEIGFPVKQVDMSRCAVLEKINDTLGLGRKVRKRWRATPAGIGWGGGKAITLEQSGKCGRANAGRCTAEKFATCDV